MRDEFNDHLSNILNQLLFAEVYLLIYGFLGIAVILLIVSKINGYRSGHDDIQFLYMIYFIVFTLNFFTNGIIFTLRIFQQDLIILGFGSVVILFLNKFIYDISTTIKTQKIWTKPVFISKHVKAWYGKYEITLTILSVLFGPICAMTFVNSRLFIADIFMMGVPHSMIVRFIGGKLFWEVLFIQRVPEVAIQIVYLWLHGFDHFVSYAFITTIIAIILLINMKRQLPEIRLMQNHWIHHTAVLMEFDSDEIHKKYKQCLLKRDGLRKLIAKQLNIKPHFIEFPCCEAMYFDIESSENRIGIDNGIISKCFGFRMYISINSHLISRRYILMKLFEARQNPNFIDELMRMWGLTQTPHIQEIVMVYNLFGHLVKPRPRNLEEPTITVSTPALLPPTSRAISASKSRNLTRAFSRNLTISPKGQILMERCESPMGMIGLKANSAGSIPQGTPTSKGMINSMDPYDSYSIRF